MDLRQSQMGVGINDLVRCPTEPFILDRNLRDFDARASNYGFASGNVRTALDIGMRGYFYIAFFHNTLFDQHSFNIQSTRRNTILSKSRQIYNTLSKCNPLSHRRLVDPRRGHRILHRQPQRRKERNLCGRSAPGDLTRRDLR